MKRIVYSLLVSVVSAGSALAYDHEPEKSGDHLADKPSAHTRGANCAPANYRLTMAFNDVSALLETGGLLFLDRANNVATYRVPKTSSVTAIYAGSLWMGGKDGTGQLKIAAVKFRNDGNDFWPGPLTVNPSTIPDPYNMDHPWTDGDRRPSGDGSISPGQCLFYDQVFTIRKAEVISFVTWWEGEQTPDPSDDVASPDSEVLSRIYDWPGNGDPTHGQDPYLAPFKDVNEDGTYNPEDGDYPWYDDILGRDDIKCGADRRISLFGDETHWWVFNDRGNIHNETGGAFIGMEIRAQAFSFATDDEINKMTFYNYELINRGTQTLFNTYFAQYIDADLGNPTDDYVGCDVSRGLGYCYNGKLNDVPFDGKLGYGTNPPAIGVDFFEGPYQDPDTLANPLISDSLPNAVQLALAAKGIVYPGLGIGYGDTIVDNERFGMRRFCYYTGGGPVNQADPESALQYYNYMKGNWRLGEQMIYGGSGFPTSGVGTPAGYMFPGDSDPAHWGTNGVDPGFDWSEFELNGPNSTSTTPGDRRFVQSAGPFTLRPGAVNNITVGIVFARSYDGDIMASVRALKMADTKAQALFDNCFRIVEPPNAPVLSVQELNNELILMLGNPSGSNNENERYEVEDDLNIVNPDNGPAYDRFYRFEGYQIYQVINDQASVSDVGDPTKARLVAQCDLKNGVTRMVNFEFDQELKYPIPVEKVDGEDKGIRHTFRLTEDLFASGARTLVNHKTYYYIAVAYAYNNYLTYDPDSGPLGQKLPYLRSRINADGTQIRALPAVPHNPVVELGGTILHSVYGQTPKITRLDGHGNGNRSLELTAASENTILATGFMENPEYDYNRGPINVKVVDPLNLKGGYYECKFTNYVAEDADDKGIDSASWIVSRYENGILQESVTSEVSIQQGNEQIIPQWGVSIEIQQHPYEKIGSGSQDKEYTTPIEASLTYGDSSRQWLRFVEDNNGFTPENWIRDGIFEPGATANCGQVPITAWNSECCYTDNPGQVPAGMFSMLLGGGVAPHKLVGYQCSYMPITYPYNSFNSAVIKSRISLAPSVNIVLTQDSSKWTRCVVVELGRDRNLNVGQQDPGKLRTSVSVGKNGKPDGSGTTGMSWFPGYAIDLETGARLHMAFGENSFLSSDNGSDMIWNPTDNYFDGNGLPVLGGQHPIWVFGYDINGTGAPAYDGVNNWVYDRYMEGTNPAYNKVFTSLMWVANVLTAEGRSYLESDATIRIRVNKEYRDFMATGKNGGKPMYSWSMDELATTLASSEQLASALDLINVVPNPYYAFSEYERNRLDNRVKIVNLPDQCTVTIYNASGKLIRSYKKDNTVTSIDWDLKNMKGIPISSGVYIIHVEVPGAGEKIIKFFGGMRQVDLENI